MKILWIDLNSSYAHSSLALPALHAQIANDSSIEWAIVSATINENVGTVVDEAYRHKPDIIAATTWLFNHEQLLHITSRLKVLLPKACLILGGPEFLGNNELFLRKYPFVDCVFRGEGEEVFPQWLTCWNQPELWNDIAGLPLYHLYEIFEDVYTLAGYNAGEIQLESLKLLPGTEMRRRAEELGIRYSPFPPYEVLETNEISVGELQTARRLSRLLDAFYNTPAWHTLTRELILNDKDFLHNFLKYLIQVNLIDQPMSLEKRGLILYEYCKLAYPEYKIQASIAWIEAGMSLKKTPAEKVKTKHQIPPEKWEVIYGGYKSNLRLCFLPLDENTKCGYWFGFETEIQRTFPVFKAKTDI